MESKKFVSPENLQKSMETAYSDMANLVEEVRSEQFDLAEYIGYDPSDILSVSADYADNTITNLNSGLIYRFSDLPGAKKCNVNDNMDILAYEGDAAYDENAVSVWYIPKFFCRTVESDFKADPDGGYRAQTVKWYISADYKQDFSTHAAFHNRKGEEIDYIFVNTDGQIWDFENNWWDDTEEKVIEHTYSLANAFLTVNGFVPMEEITKETVTAFEELPSPDDPDISKRPAAGYTYYVFNDTDGENTICERYFWNGEKYVRWAAKE